jgi:[protein-PII] uridylyltransferase
MTMRGRVPAQLVTRSPSNNTRRDAMDMAVQPPRTGAFPANRNSGTAPIAAIHQTLRAIANESGPGEGLNRVKLLRPLVAQAHDILREHFESGGSAEDYLRGRAQLADGVVVGVLRMASISSGIRDGSTVAPLAAIATGGYGRRELAPGSDLDVLFLLPESSSSHAGDVEPATSACIGAIVASLWDLGFVLDHAARSVKECLELAKDRAAVLAGLVDRRYLWGRFGLFAALDTDLAALFAGPDAGCWQAAVSSALSATHHHALYEVPVLEDEPDVKRGPGGLRDLQRALWANTCAAGRSISLKQSSLIEAHRFLWLVRCHLHFLAGRADDRLSMPLQFSIARRLGLAESHKAAAPPLLDLFRYHARNIVAATESAPRSPVRLSNNR